MALTDAQITALKDAWQTKIDESLGACPIDLAEANIMLERYAGGLQQQADYEAGKIQSYTIAGRTFTYKSAAQAAEELRKLKNELGYLVFGDTSLIDLNLGYRTGANG